MQALAEAEKLPFLETSALKNVNVEEAFMVILGDIYAAATRKIFTQVGNPRRPPFCKSVARGRRVVLSGQDP